MTNEETKPLKRTESFAKLLHCPTEHMNQTIACLRNKTIDEMLNAQKIAGLVGQMPSPIFEDEFLPLNTMEALKSGKINKDINFMYGITKGKQSLNFKVGIQSKS